MLLLPISQVGKQQSKGQPNRNNGQSQPQKANEQPSDTRIEKSQAQVDLAAQGEAERQKQERDAKEDEFKAAQLRQNWIIVYATIWIGVFAFFSFITGLVYAVISIKTLRAVKEQARSASEQVTKMQGQWETMDRQARIADQQREILQKQIDSAETTERAYIGIANMELLVGSDDEPVLLITWINGGKTPAWRFRCVPTLNIGEKAEPKRYPIPDDDISDIRNSFIPAGAERTVSYTEFGIALSNEVLAELRGNANKRLYAVMKGSYRDVRWKPREFEYWALYDADRVSPKFIEIESDYEKKQTDPR